MRATAMVTILLAISATLGLFLGFHYTWKVLIISGLFVVIVCTMLLQQAAFDSLTGIGIVIACLTVNQLAYLIGVGSTKGD